MNQHADVVIVGGGVIGLTTAYFLAKSGVRVRVFERGEFGREASWAGAGIIPPGNPAKTTSAYERLRAESSNQFAGFSAMLREITGIDNGYRRCGGIELLSPQERAAVFAAWQAEEIRYSELSPAELHALEPNLRAPVELAYYLPDLAQVRNPWHMRALVAICATMRVGLRSGTSVMRITSERGSVRLSLSDGSVHSSGCVLLAAGAWSSALLEPLGVRLPVHPVRGQIVLLRSPEPLLHRVFVTGKQYLVPRADGRTLVGSTEEPEAGFIKLNNAHGVMQLLQLALHWVPLLSQAEVETTWAGLRPGSADGLPYLGRIPGHERLFIAGGHYRAGIQLSIATGRALSDLVQERQPRIPLDDFCLERLPMAEYRATFRS